MATRIVFNRAAFRQLRTEPAVQRRVHEIASRIAAAAGPGYVVEDRVSPRSRARSAVVAETYKAKADAARGGLQRALEAGRGA